jgi:LysM repeat protein
MFPVLYSKYWVRVALVTAVFFAFPQWLSALTPEPKELISQDTGFYYTVQKGDTLWDISKKFFGSPVIWPDLWQKNDQLPNPHWIYPGQKLRLYIKDGVGQFEVVESPPSGPLPFAATPLTPPRKPSSTYHYSHIDQVGFIRIPAAAPHGILFKSKDNKNMISLQDVVYIRPEGGHQLLPGQKYTVFRTLYPFGNQNDAEKIGLQHYLVGIVQITDQQPDLAVATVIQSFRTIQVDDLLMPYQEKSPEIEYKECREDLEGHLILAEEHYKLIGDNMVGFIDRGAQDGVEAGQSYVLYYRENNAKPMEAMNAPLLPAIEVGTFIVLHTEKTTSSVLVTRCDRELAPGVNFRASIR